MFVQDLDVGVVLACRSPLSGTTFFLPVLKKLWIAKNSHAAALIHQSKCRAAVQPLFILPRSRQNYRHWQVNDTPCRAQTHTQSGLRPALQTHPSLQGTLTVFSCCLAQKIRRRNKQQRFKKTANIKKINSVCSNPHNNSRNCLLGENYGTESQK